MKPPFSKSNRDDWQMAGPTGPRTKRKAKAMRRPPFPERIRGKSK